MTYAQIQNGFIVNVIVLNDVSLLSVFSEGYQYCVQIDQLSPEPQIGWAYDGENFSNPNGV